MPRWLWVAIGTASIAFCTSSGPKPFSASRSRANPATISCAQGQAVIPWAWIPKRPRPILGGDRCAEEDVDLLGPLPGCRGQHRLGISRSDGDLGAHPTLALAHSLGHVGGEDLGSEGLAQNHLVDRLAYDLLEARHVDAGLAGVEVNETLKVSVEEVLGAVGLHPNHLLDPGDPDP